MLKHLRERANITQEELAEVADMTPLAIQRYEQYLYAKPSLMYIAGLAQVTGGDPQALQGVYEQERANRILAATTALSSLPLDVFAAEAVGETHPFIHFADTVLDKLGRTQSNMSWCTLTCFHPGQYHRFLTVGRVIPAVQRKMLRDAGMSPSAVNRLNKAIEEFHEQG